MSRVLLVAALGIASASPVSAEPVAIGVAPSAYLSSTDTWGFTPELLAHTYAPLRYDNVYLRPGGRVSMTGLIQNDMSSELRLEEHDLSVHAELGIVHSGRVVPSLTLLAGVTYRWVSLEAKNVDVTMSNAGRNEWLPSLGAQLGVGLPLHERVLVEPFVRYELVYSDARTHLRWGFEATFSFGR